MKNISIFLKIGMNLLIMGCGVMRKHPTYPKSEWAQNHAECKRKVRESIRPCEDAYNALDKIWLIKKCMKLKGWHK